jgi:hypothetical protein
MKADKSNPNNSSDKKKRPRAVAQPIRETQRGTSVLDQRADDNKATLVADNRNTPRTSPTPPAYALNAV